MIRSNISLKAYNTFGIDASAKYFAAFDSYDKLCMLLDDHRIKKEKRLVLGGGSNILLTKDFDGVVLKNNIRKIEKIKEDASHVWVRTGAGENWHQFVLHCIANGYAGAENLSLIPGCTGASPMQNIGAYGVEIKDIFYSLDAYHLNDEKVTTFYTADCGFGYRESVFKNIYKNQFIITHVTYKLNKQPAYHTSYGAIQQELDAMGVKDLSIKAISDAVIRIRSSKLPDPAVTGNAGSFFKNPVVPIATYEKIKKEFAAMPAYIDEAKQEVKIPAGWLIETCGWKGFRAGDAGVHPNQALVLVNYGNASGEEIFDLSTNIKKSVVDRFGIELEREVNII